jgi:hypothetical protein
MQMGEVAGHGDLAMHPPLSLFPLFGQANHHPCTCNSLLTHAPATTSHAACYSTRFGMHKKRWPAKQGIHAPYLSSSLSLSLSHSLYFRTNTKTTPLILQHQHLVLGDLFCLNTTPLSSCAWQDWRAGDAKSWQGHAKILTLSNLAPPVSRTEPCLPPGPLPPCCPPSQH